MLLSIRIIFFGDEAVKQEHFMVAVTFVHHIFSRKLLHVMAGNGILFRRFPCFHGLILYNLATQIEVFVGSFDLAGVQSERREPKAKEFMGLVYLPTNLS